MVQYSMSAKQAKDMAYSLGVSIGIREGVTPPTGLHQAINWGAPAVQLEGPASQVGLTGRQVIKELASANNVELTWHAPPSKEFELAVPDDELNQNAKKMLKESIKFAEETGVKLINMHTTNSVPRLPDDQILVYDNVSNSLTAIKLPAYESEQMRKALAQGDAKKVEEIKDNFVKKKDEERTIGFEHNIIYYEEIAQRAKKDFENTQALRNNIKEMKEHDVPSEQIKIFVEKSIDKEIREMWTSKDVEKFIKELDGRVKSEGLYYKSHNDYIKNMREQYAPYISKEYRGDVMPEVSQKPVMLRGEDMLVKNFAKNFAELAQDAMKKGIKLSVENTDSRYMFSTPEELNNVMDAIYGEMEKKGVSRKEAEKYVGTCFDFGHANTIKNMNIGGQIMPDDIFKIAEKIKGPILHVHVHENYGDVDAHMPLGETARTEKERLEKAEKLQEWLAEKKITAPAVFEIGAIGGLGYAVSMEATNPQMYITSSGEPTWVVSGPSYIASLPTDSVNMDKREHYFYESWIGEDIV